MKELIETLKEAGAEFVEFADVSGLPEDVRMGYSFGIIVGIPVCKEGLQDTLAGGKSGQDDFNEKEAKTDGLALLAEKYIKERGYNAYAQSFDQNEKEGRFVRDKRRSVLPNKTIARLAGMGWIGKNAVMVTEEYGSAISYCCILTDMPLAFERKPIKAQHCGNCTACKDICHLGLIKNTQEWYEGLDRNDMLDPFPCDECLACVAVCPWTKKYAEGK